MNGCSCRTHTEPTTSPPRVSPEQTVAEISRRPGALDVLEQLGINHCCGAHLSLREGAAAAGVSLDELLRALEAPVKAPA